MSDDLDGLMADLAEAQTSGRNAIERHAEFRQVFLGSDMGKRVLYDILAAGHVWQSSVVRAVEKGIDPYLTHVREGERALAITILKWIHKQPTIAPDKQRSQKRE